jgi:hypothetical protein
MAAHWMCGQTPWKQSLGENGGRGQKLALRLDGVVHDDIHETVIAAIREQLPRIVAAVHVLLLRGYLA